MKSMRQVVAIVSVVAALSAGSLRADEVADRMGQAVSNYVARVITGLGKVADQHPTVDTFRGQMKALMEGTEGVFGASLIDTNFVIRQVYYRRDFLAVGFDLKKVKELDYFWALMRQKPEPQLSEPGHGNLIQPRLVAMRYPFLENGKLQGIVSVMIHTEAFLKATGLDQCKAYRITCLGKEAESKGTLAVPYHEVKLALPSTEWVIQFE